jgi:hypothetical protein
MSSFYGATLLGYRVDGWNSEVNEFGAASSSNNVYSGSPDIELHLRSKFRGCWGRKWRCAFPPGPAFGRGPRLRRFATVAGETGLAAIRGCYRNTSVHKVKVRLPAGSLKCDLFAVGQPQGKAETVFQYAETVFDTYLHQFSDAERDTYWGAVQDGLLPVLRLLRDSPRPTGAGTFPHSLRAEGLPDISPDLTSDLRES